MTKKSTKIKMKFGGNVDPSSERLLLEFQKSLDNMGVIPSPTQTLHENNLRLDKAEAKSSSALTSILDVLGSAAMQVGSSIAGSGMDLGLGKKDKVKAAYGGTFGQEVEVEGGEVAQDPAGRLVEFMGPDHEQGGIDTILPGGTDVFSKRIKIDDVPLSKRKKKREKYIADIEKKLSKNPSDTLLKNSLARAKETTVAEDDFDMQLQRMVAETENPPQRKMAYGGTTLDLLDNENLLNILGNLSAPIIPIEPVDPVINAAGDKQQPTVVAKPDETVTKTGVVKDAPETDSKKLLGKTDSEGSDTNKLGNLLDAVTGAGMPTAGDALGLFGNIYQAYQPRNLTKYVRSTDTPNINPYTEYGKGAVSELDKAKTDLAMSIAAARKGIAANTNATMKANRNSSMGANTQRALDLASLAAANNAETDLLTAGSQQMMNLRNMLAQTLLGQDQVVMGGEAARDIADRQDRDNFFTQLSKDEAALGQAMGHTAKAINNIKERGVMENTLNNSLENFDIDLKTGKYKIKKGTIQKLNKRGQEKAVKEFEQNAGLELLDISTDLWDTLTLEQKISLIEKNKSK